MNRDPQNTRLAEMQNEIQVNSIANSHAAIKIDNFCLVVIKKKTCFVLNQSLQGRWAGSKRKGLGNFRLPVLVLIRWVNNQDDRF